MINLQLPQTPLRRTIMLALGVMIILGLFLGFLRVKQNSLSLRKGGDTYGIPAGFISESDSGYYGAPQVGQVMDKSARRSDFAAESIAPVLPDTPPAGSAKIIKQASLTLLVKDIRVAADGITAIRMGIVGSQPGNASFNEYTSGVRTGNMAMWVPSDRFDDALIQIKKLALRVENENISVADVSAQVVDLEARLRNLRTTETQYSEIMKRSGTIPDVVNVARELSKTRGEIEQIQGEFNRLHQQVSLSLITITLSEEAHPVEVKNEWRPTTIVKEASRQALRDLTLFANMIIILLIQLPVYLLYFGFWVGMIWLFAKLVIYIVRRAKEKSMI